MNKTINTDGIHRNGNAELNVGINGNEFTLKRNSAEDKIVTLTDPNTGEALSLAGSATTPDWNQNDENASDYIKNRTHWFGPGYHDIYNGTLPFRQNESYDFGLGVDAYGYDFELKGYPNADEYPSSLTVVIDGEQYECSTNREIISIGDSDYLSLSVMYMGYNRLFIYCTEGLINSYYSIKVYGDGYHALDERFIPDSIARTSQVSQIVSSTIEQLKESGELNGYTPQKGVDYWTEEDKLDIINTLIQTLPRAEEAMF